MIATNYNQFETNRIFVENPGKATIKVVGAIQTVASPNPEPTYAQHVIRGGIEATFSYWMGYGVAKLGLSKGISPFDFARLSCISSFARPALSDQFKSLLGCKGDNSWRDLTELFATAVGTNLIGFGVCAMFGTQIEVGSLLRNAIVSTSFAIISETLTDILKKNMPPEETEQDGEVENEEDQPPESLEIEVKKD